jgi:hypothetical protein
MKSVTNFIRLLVLTSLFISVGFWPVVGADSNDLSSATTGKSDVNAPTTTNSYNVIMKDGTVLVGGIQIKEVKFIASYGPIEVNLNDVITFNDGFLTLNDGTKLKGTFVDGNLGLKTTRGQMNLPFASITSISIPSASASQVSTATATSSSIPSLGNGANLTGKEVESFSKMLTVEDIKELIGASVKSDAIQTQIENSQSKYSPQDFVAAQQANIDPAIIKCMKSHSDADPSGNHPTPGIKTATIITDPAVEKLCEQLEQDNPGKVKAALNKLRDKKLKDNASEAVPKVLPCLANSKPDVVREACRTLAIIGNQDAVPALLPLLTNERPDIVREACRTLANIGNKDTISSLEPLLTNLDHGIRDEAYKAIAKLRAKS